MPRGRFISIEGGEGTGKSTQVRHLVAKLTERGVAAIATREPGGAPGAEDIRKLLVNGEAARWEPMSELLLHTAARVEHVAKTILPALMSGTWVVTDRFVDSTRVYQGEVQGVGRLCVDRLHDMALDGLLPDRTLILDLPAEKGLARADGRGTGENRYERMGAAFHEALRNAYRELAMAEPLRCRLIDADGSEEAVSERIWAAVQPMTGAT